jgi:hypothetical protein
MAMKGHKPGGGIKSRVNVSPSVRTGSGGRGTRPAGVAQIGNAWGDHVTRRGDSTGFTGEKLHNDRNFNPVPFGNAKALDVGTGGCGTGRTLYGQAGSQGTHGNVSSGNPPPNRYRKALEQE